MSFHLTDHRGFQIFKLFVSVIFIDDLVKEIFMNLLFLLAHEFVLRFKVFCATFYSSFTKNLHYHENKELTNYKSFYCPNHTLIFHGRIKKAIHDYLLEDH